MPDETTRNAAKRRDQFITVSEKDWRGLKNEVALHVAALDSLERILFGDVWRRSRDEMEARAEDTERYEAHAALAQVLGWGDFRACSTAQQEQFAEWAQEVGLPHLGNPHIRPELFRA